MTDTAIYAYCVVGGAAPALAGAPPGIAGSGAPRLLEVAKDLRLVVSDVDAEAFSEDAISEGLRDVDWVSERAMAHESMIAHFLEADALIPMKMFTLFRTEARACAHVVDRETDVRAALERVAGCVELGVRMRIDEDAARRARAAAAIATGAEKPSSGAAFLARKKGLKEAAARSRQDALEAAESAAKQIARLARETRVVPPPEGLGATSLLLEAACLVPRAKRRTIEDTVEALRAEVASRGVAIELTGPWAPYHFIGART